MDKMIVCDKCQKENNVGRYFCEHCGSFLNTKMFEDPKVYKQQEGKVMRILENLQYVPHSKIIWNDTIDLYAKKVEKYLAIMKLPELASQQEVSLEQNMIDFLDLCYKPEFQIAFVGTIKTGKSTLINSLLGHNYASMSVTPETAALTKFRSSPKDYIRIQFYSKKEWKALWDSRTSGADAFMKEYNELNADSQRDKWVGHEIVYKELSNNEIEKELSVWSSSKSAEHYFVKEIEVGISSLSDDFPKQIVFVDTPGLSDPVAYRSEITKQYIRKANAVFVCVDAQKVQKNEVETISSVFSFSAHNKSKVHIIATHWDKLNKPEMDWKEQKKWMKKQFVGKGFYDTQEMAEVNIMHSAAHIFNLCRDYEQLKDDDRISLMQFALGMKIDPMALQANLQKIIKYTNICNIQNVINQKLAKNYESLLTQDIEKRYTDILYTLKRIGEDCQKELDSIIEMSYADREAMRKKVEEQKKNYEEVRQCSEQLTHVLSLVKKNTQKRLDEILPELDAMAKSRK